MAHNKEIKNKTEARTEVAACLFGVLVVSYISISYFVSGYYLMFLFNTAGLVFIIHAMRSYADKHEVWGNTEVRTK